MADFLPNLWSSVFTPGATPTLLVATNATFAALQVLLLALLVVTYSIHFAVLSVLCAGLWYAINWFAVELRAAQEAQAAEEERARKKRRETGRVGEVEDSADDEGEDTEVEEGKGSIRDSTASLNTPAIAVGNSRSRYEGSAIGATTGSSGIESSEARLRRLDDGDRSGEISTDSEWERVSQDGDR